MSGGGHFHHIITDRVVIIAEPTIPEEHPDDYDREDYSIMPQVGNRLFYQSCTRISNGETGREREVKEQDPKLNMGDSAVSGIYAVLCTTEGEIKVCMSC